MNIHKKLSLLIASIVLIGVSACGSAHATILEIRANDKVWALSTARENPRVEYQGRLYDEAGPAGYGRTAVITNDTLGRSRAILHPRAKPAIMSPIIKPRQKPEKVKLRRLPGGKSLKQKIARILKKFKLPKPRKLSPMSEDQMAMYELTEEVGESFSYSKSVRNAQMSRPFFVKMFTTLIHRESNFDPNVVSSAGAQGLGQLMPGTAKELGVVNSFSPEENLEGSAMYLTDMIDQFGSPEIALAAYNAGPGAVRKYGGIPPYKETRQYVSDILNGMGSNAYELSGASPNDWDEESKSAQEKKTGKKKIHQIIMAGLKKFRLKLMGKTEVVWKPMDDSKAGESIAFVKETKKPSSNKKPFYRVLFAGLMKRGPKKAVYTKMPDTEADVKAKAGRRLGRM